MDLQFGSNWVLVNTGIDLKTGREIRGKSKGNKAAGRNGSPGSEETGYKLTEPPTTQKL